MKLSVAIALSTLPAAQGQLARVMHGRRAGGGGGKLKPQLRKLDAGDLSMSMELGLTEAALDATESEEVVVAMGKSGKGSKKGGDTCGVISYGSGLYLNPLPLLTPDDPSPSFPTPVATLACDAQLSGSSEGASDEDRVNCFGLDFWGSVVTYKVIGIDGTITVDTCDDVNFDTVLTAIEVSECSVSGSTIAQCIALNDDACGLQSSITFDAKAGAEYLIQVGGYSGATGNYTLSVDCNPGATTPAVATAEQIGKYAEEKIKAMEDAGLRV